MQSKRTIILCALLKSLLDSSLSYAINFYDAHAHAHVGKWVPDELRAFTKKEEEEDKPYVPPAYYGEDEEEQLDSEDDEVNEASSSELEETSLPQGNDNLEIVTETQEKCSKIEKVDTVFSNEQSSNTDHDETRVRNRRKGDNVEDVVTVRNSDEGIKDESTSFIATNSDEDASTASSNNSSGIMFVSNSKDCGTSSSWSRYQQKQLEWALVQYPKFAKDRWENIAKAVPGKSKVHT